MIATHAKKTEQSTMLGNTTINLGMKHPCACNSGKKFKHCCYEKPTKGWGWVVLGAQDLVPIALKKPEISELPIIIAHPSYKKATEYVELSGMKGQVGGEVFIVRMNIKDVITHIEMQFPKGDPLLIVMAEEITPDGEGQVIEVQPGGTASEDTPDEDEPAMVPPGVTVVEKDSTIVYTEPTSPEGIIGK